MLPHRVPKCADRGSRPGQEQDFDAGRHWLRILVMVGTAATEDTTCETSVHLAPTSCREGVRGWMGSLDLQHQLIALQENLVGTYKVL